MTTLVYHSLSGMPPSYLATDCRLVSNEGCHQLRSADSRTCIIWGTYSYFVDRCFCLKLCNSLPVHLSYERFKRLCKSYPRLCAVLSMPPHDQLVVLGDLNAVSGTNRQGFENVVGPYGSGLANDNSFQLLTLCSTTNLSILGSWFARKNIHRHTWIFRVTQGHRKSRYSIEHIRLYVFHSNYASI